jgi:Ca-activated chloride channel homolog
MSLSQPLLLIPGLLVAAALIVGAVLAGRRRSAALAAAGVSVAGRRNNQLGLWLSLGGVVVLAVAAARAGRFAARRPKCRHGDLGDGRVEQHECR